MRSGSDHVMHDSQPAIGAHDEPLLQAIHITKRYGDFVANDSISIDVMPAEIHALLGENGAGKSTLVKMHVRPAAAERRANCAGSGEKIELAGPSQARALGIGMVFQHFSLFENLTVAENVALGLPPTRIASPRFRRGSPRSRASTACRSIRSARCGGCRSASASASRSCAA